MEKKKIEQAQKLIGAANQILITTHRSPDGDAIGSSLAMYHYLKKLGKSVYVVVPNEYPDFLSWLNGNDQIVIYEQESKEARKIIRESDLIFSLDYNNLSRTFVMQSALEKSNADFILIDHHQQPDSYPAVSFSDTSSCSTAQLVYDFIEHSGHLDLIDNDIAQAIYMGIMTDSGSFRFDSVTERTHEIAGRLIQNGLDHYKIHQKVYDTNSLNRLKLLGYALSSKLKTLIKGRVALITLSLEELDRFDFQPGDTEGIVNYALSVKGVQIAVFAREGNNQVKISFRSKGGFNVNQLARKHFNGGGHNAAAGGSFHKEIDFFELALTDVLKEYETELQSHND